MLTQERSNGELMSVSPLSNEWMCATANKTTRIHRWGSSDVWYVRDLALSRPAHFPFMPEPININPPPAPEPGTKKLIIDMHPTVVRQFVNDVREFANNDPSLFIKRAFALYRALCQDSPNGYIFVRIDGQDKEQRLQLWSPNGQPKS